MAIKFEQIITMARKDILDQQTVQMKLQRMAYEIVENNLNEKRVILVGVKDNGSVIAKKVRDILNAIGSLGVRLNELTIDKKMPAGVELSENINFNDEIIIIVDDVANSGKTFLYSLKPFLEFRPKKIQTMALVERTHKTFPIHLDYTGLSVATTLQEHIYVQVNGNEVVGAYME